MDSEVSNRLKFGPDVEFIGLSLMWQLIMYTIEPADENYFAAYFLNIMYERFLVLLAHFMHD